MSDCCSVPAKKPDVEKSHCPTCGEKGKPVKAMTIRSLTRRDLPTYALIADGFFCTNPEDPTVYFIPERDLTIGKKDVIDRIGLKETEEPITVCYCFRHTKAEIESDYLKHNRSTIEDDIRQKVNDKLCSCEVSNPSGRCCLGDVRQTYGKLKKGLILESS